MATQVFKAGERVNSLYGARREALEAMLAKELGAAS